MSTSTETTRRALGALTGLALGDALGMPTQSMSPSTIRAEYGRVMDLVNAVPTQPIAPSMSAGSVTDDTEQAILTGELLVAGDGHIDPLAFAEALLAWEDDMRARGSLDLLGPSTKLALEQVRAGADPRTTGRLGTTNGASMRVTPIGIAFSLDDRSRFLEAVHESCMVTHDTRQGLEAAALIAAAVSAAVSGATVEDAISAAIETAHDITTATNWSPKASVLARAEHALAISRDAAGDNLADLLRSVVGTSVESSESVACALVIARNYASAPFEGLCFAANLGGDTDTIAAMAGAILGAAQPAGLPTEAVNRVIATSHLNLDKLVGGLVRLRLQN